MFNENGMKMKKYTTVALKENQHLKIDRETSLTDVWMIGYTDNERDHSLDMYYSKRELIQVPYAIESNGDYTKWDMQYFLNCEFGDGEEVYCFDWSVSERGGKVYIDFDWLDEWDTRRCFHAEGETELEAKKEIARQAFKLLDDSKMPNRILDDKPKPYRWLLDKYNIAQGSTYKEPTPTLRQCAAWISEYFRKFQ